jgi:ATP-dependent helicase/nuclease subunit B
LSLRVIAGPAGSGKTTYITSEIVSELLRRHRRPIGGQGGATGSGFSSANPPILLIVPDQATFQMERKVLEDSRLRGFFDLHILSFRRLCLKVLDECGGVSLPFITQVGRSMAIQSVLWEHRKDLTVFAPMVDYPGFRETLGRTLQELSLYEVSPGDMQPAAKSATNLPYLEQKIRDLEVVLRAYREFLAGRFFDPEDYLEMAAVKIPGSSLVRGSTVWIDGFSGFTPKEYKVLRAIMESAEQTNVALCLDRRELSGPVSASSLFYPTRQVYEKVLALASDAGVSVEPVVHLGEDGVPPRFRGTFDLARLEMAARLSGGTPGRAEAHPLSTAPGEPEVTGRGTCEESPDRPGVVLVSATNPMAEVEFVAREIVKLVRDEGLRYRDITVEARDLSGYADLIELVFADHGIPFFLDRKRSLTHHPLSELLRSSLEVVTGSFPSDSVFRYLKTDLVPVPREVVDRLENYVLAHGIQGERWIAKEPWRYARKSMVGEEEVVTESDDARFADSARRQAVVHLERFYRRLKGRRTSLTAREISRAVYDLLTDLDVPATLERWQALAEESGDLAEAQDHAGVWDKVMEILEQAEEILGEREVDLKTYAVLVDAGLEDIRLGVIPPSLDQVLIGAIDRSRQPECKVTFLIGALSGVFPRRQAEDSVFTDEERAYLSEKGIELEPDSITRQLNEQYLVYIALTRPSMRLYISYPLGDAEGKAQTSSHVLGMVKRVFSGLGEVTAAMEPPGRWPDDLDYVVPARARGIAARRLSLLRQGLRAGDAWAEVYRWLIEPERIDVSRVVLGSLSFTNKLRPLDGSLVRRLYGSAPETSVSRLERFSACPFYHFASDGLGLRERDIYRLEPADAGTFLHNAMKEFVERLSSLGADWKDLTEADITSLANSVVDKLVPEVRDELFMSSARYRYVADALRRIVDRAALVTAEHMRRGGFRPVCTEVRFGMGEGLPPYRIKVSPREEVVLRGQIDRVDVGFTGMRPYIRIVDYKSSTRSLDLVDVWSGLSLQLLVYLIVALENWPLIARMGGVAGTALPGPGAPLTRKGPLPAGALYFTLRDPMIPEKGPVPPDVSARNITKALRMTGLLIDDLDVLRVMDCDSRSHSDIIPVTFTSKGVGGRSSVARLEDFEALLGYVRRKVKEMCDRIFSGDIEIAPYRRGEKRACTFCPYGPLCSFDILLPGNRYRVIAPPPGGIWEEIRGGGDARG